MATTSIWSIKNNLKQSINYIINSEKTINEDYGKDTYNYLELSPNKDYNFKNEKIHYVSNVINLRDKNYNLSLLLWKTNYKYHYQRHLRYNTPYPKNLIDL